MSTDRTSPSLTIHLNDRPEGQRLLVDYLDLYLLVVAAPIALLVGSPVVGYAIGTTAWLLLRGVAVAVHRRALAMTNVAEQVALRLSYRLMRVVLLAGATILALDVGGKENGVTTLLVISLSFTVRLSVTVIDAW